jgi:hypothetical protein
MKANSAILDVSRGFSKELDFIKETLNTIPVRNNSNNNIPLKAKLI